MCRLETRGATSDVLSTPLAVEDVKPNSTSFKPYALQGTTKAKALLSTVLARCRRACSGVTIARTWLRLNYVVGTIDGYRRSGQGLLMLRWS